MNVIIDWLQFTIFPDKYEERMKTYEIDYLVKDVLGLSYNDFEITYPLYGYTKAIKCGNIRVLYNSVFGDSMGVHIQFSGKGCREYEKMEGFDWIQFFLDLEVRFRPKYTRVDIAIDDNKYLDMKKIIWYLERGYVSTRFKSYKLLNEKKINGEELGKTVYLGSRKSDIYMRIYDKNIESDGFINAVRLEIVFKDENANNFIRSLWSIENFNSLEFITNKVLNYYVRFIRPNNEVKKNKSRVENAEWWSEFLITLEKMSLGKSKERVTLARIINWMEKQCASSMKLICETKGKEYLLDMVKKATLNKNQEELKVIYLKTGSEG